MSKFKKILRKILGKGLTHEEIIKILKEGGANIGDRLHLYGRDLNIDLQFPYMLTIGDDVEITANVTILTHDYSWSVVKKYSGELLGGVGPVEIGNNVFIGNGALILMNTRIGHNTIIGAQSIVHGTFPDNVVIAGNPARVICSIEEFIEKRRKRQLEEAIAIVRNYRKAFGKNPSKDKLPAYFWLFEPRTEEISNPMFLQRMNLKGNFEVSAKLFKDSKPLFDNFEAFLESIPFENEKDVDSNKSCI